MEKDFTEPSVEEVDKLYSQLDKDAKQGGYNLNPDADFVRGLIKGLLINEKRYGYRACPCRLASGDKIRGPGSHLPLRLQRCRRY